MGTRNGLLVRGGLGIALLTTAALIGLQAAVPAPVRADHQAGIYRGTHDGGGTVTFQTGPDGILTFAATDIPGVDCFVTELGARYGLSGLPIVDHAFDDREEFGITPRGRFLPDGRAEGSFVLFPSSAGTCRTDGAIAWTAQYSGPAPATRTSAPTRTRTPSATRTLTPPSGGRTALFLGEAHGGAPVQVVTVTNKGTFFVRSLRIGALPPRAPFTIASSACEPRPFTLTGVEDIFAVRDNRFEIRTPGTSENGTAYEVVITGRYGQNGFAGTVAWVFTEQPGCSTVPVNWSASLVQGTGSPLVPDTEPAAPAPSGTPAATVTATPVAKLLSRE